MRIIVQDITRRNTQPGYTGAELRLPASDTAIRSVFEQAGIGRDTDEYLIRWPKQIPEEVPQMLAAEIGRLVEKNQPPIPALNLLALRLVALEQEGRDVMDYLAVHREPERLHEIINWTYNFDCCKIDHEIHSNEELLLRRSGIHPDSEEYQEALIAPYLFAGMELSYGGYHITEVEQGWVTPSGYCTYDSNHQWRDFFAGTEPIFHDEWNRGEAAPQTQERPDSRTERAHTADMLANEYAHFCGITDLPATLMQAEADALNTYVERTIAVCDQAGHSWEEVSCDGENGRSAMECMDCGQAVEIRW